MQNKATKTTPMNGSWNMRNVRFHTASNIGAWTYVCVQSDRYRGQVDEEAAYNTVQAFQQHLQQAGINASGLLRGPPSIHHVDHNEGLTFNSVNNTFRLLATSTKNPKPRFVLVILPFADTPLYNAIKTIADTRAGIHTVCVVMSKFSKQDGGQYFGNIALKFNLKAGGINQTVDPAKLGVISEGKTMVVGLDVTHPSPGSKETAPSVSGMVASLDPQLGQWTSIAKVQEKARTEMVTGLEAMFINGPLKAWSKKNKTLPENIIIYRDGVSEGQYQLVLDVELPQFRNACRQKYPADMTKKHLPKITIVICGKRHHTRFYPKNEADADKNSNCVAGTVVDRGVTESRSWDFFLQAHGCLKGTARPCHYYVILDEIFRFQKVKPPHKNTADALEDLTNNMCHLFGRATKAVSLCPPAYYADLLCTRMRCYLSDQYDPTDRASTPSVTGSVTSSTFLAGMAQQISVHEDIAGSMFFI
jgi:eukaryotic translation initiation factor 2C